MFVAMWLKPLWRDELITLYLSDRSQNFEFLMDKRWGISVHPPAYHYLLWVWNHITSHPFLQKCLSLIFLGLGALTLKCVTKGERRQTLYIYMLVALGSYWVIYFSTEIRPYILNFTLCSITVFLTDHIMKEKLSMPRVILWVLAGVLLSFTHYFGGLWFASLSLVIGLSQLKERRTGRFVMTGLLAVLALVPIGLWLTYSLPRMIPSEMVTDQSTLEKFTVASHQFLRGLVVKTFGSNPLITFLGFSGILIALRRANKLYTVLIAASLLTVLIAFTVHLTLIDMIKERAFIVIMPAILYIFADQLSVKESKLMQYVPWVTAIMPFIFMSEYFKNKERFDDLQSGFARYGATCQSAGILAYYRPIQPEGFSEYATDRIMGFDIEGFQSRPVLMDIRTIDTAPDMDCPVKAVALMLRKKDAAVIAEIESHLIRLGYNIETIEAEHYGKGRNILWIQKESP